ncbi:alpha/beta fold hydrolase [Bernardetia sp. ABR2-2B]|uniref:alpha/beta hydrolase family protein n=1 Tax=Bernardetia sp. ABR2-2B TaxID=3127472 RepID=UPI0030D25206
MKTLFLSLLTFLFSMSLMAQNAENPLLGNWKGELSVSGMKLPLIFHISKIENEQDENTDIFSATMDSPAQGAKDIPVSEVTFLDNNLIVTISTLGASYEGKLISKTQIEGTFKQAGQNFTLILNKMEKDSEKEILNRPQEPKAPFDYKIEEVQFQNKKAKEETILAGTLTLPKNTNQETPVVILISGSGAQDRNQEILGHKPFLVIADYLTKNGIAVLRYDDRGTAQSTGNFESSTSKDFATDVEAAIDFLKTRDDIDTKKIGLIGHSEGGMIAPMVAANRKKDVAFIVLLAGTGVNGGDLLVEQQQAIGKLSGMSKEDLAKSKRENEGAFRIVNEITDEKLLHEKMKLYLTDSVNQDDFPASMTKEEYINAQLSLITSPWMSYFLRYNPKENLSNTVCPVLAVNGQKDLQVDAKINLKAIEKALRESGNNKVTVKYFPNLNHLFQTAETGLPSEYGTLEETFSPLVLEAMKDWIEQQTN